MNKHTISLGSSVLILIAILGSSHCTQAASIEVLKNDGFEAGDFTDWSEPIINPNPWAVVSVNSYSGSFSAYNPAKSTAIAATTLYQSFAPTPIENITASGFWYFHQGGLGTVGLATLLTFSDGTWVQDTLFANDPSYKQNQWAFRDLMPTLLSNSEKQLVEIGFFPKGGGDQYIDDVSLTVVRTVPEPTTIFGLATVLGCGALLKRGNSQKRNKS